MAGGRGRRVAVSGQLHRDQTPVPGGGEGTQYRREVDLALAERQVFVDAASHVLDLDVGEAVGCQFDAAADAVGFEAPAVTDVEGEAEAVGEAELAVQPAVAA